MSNPRPYNTSDIGPDGSQSVALTGEHFMKFVRAGESRLREIPRAQA